MAKNENEVTTLWVTFKVQLTDDTIVYHKIKMTYLMYKSLLRTVKISSLTSSSNRKISGDLFREILIQSLDFKDIAMRYYVK